MFDLFEDSLNYQLRRLFEKNGNLYHKSFTGDSRNKSKSTIRKSLSKTQQKTLRLDLEDHDLFFSGMD